MQNYIKSISIYLILQLSICFASEITSVDILERSIRRLDGVDHLINVDITTYKKGKESKKKNSTVSVHWGTGDIYKMIYLEEGSDGNKGRELLIHEYNDKRLRTWVKYPKSGKIKEIKDKKLSKKIDISDITIPLSFLENESKILRDDEVNGFSCKVVEVLNDDQTILMWIDQSEYLIHKREFYDKKSKLYKSTHYSDLSTISDIKTYTTIETKHLKDKTSSILNVQDIKVQSFKGENKFKAPSR